MASRAAVRGLRLLQKGGFLGPAREGPAATRHAVRSVANAAVAPALPCSGCEKKFLDLTKQIQDLRKEMMGDDQRLWLLYEGLLDVNHQMLLKMASMEAESIKRQAIAVECMVKTSYRILGSGGMFMLGMFTVMSPLLKSAWQHDTIEEVERRRVLALADGPAAEGKAGKEDEGTGVEGDSTEERGLPCTGGKGAVKTCCACTHKIHGIGLPCTGGKGAVKTCCACTHKIHGPGSAPAEGKGVNDVQNSAVSAAEEKGDACFEEEKGDDGSGRADQEK